MLFLLRLNFQSLEMTYKVSRESALPAAFQSYSFREILRQKKPQNDSP